MGTLTAGEETPTYDRELFGKPWEPIADAGMQGCVWRGLIWLRGPCGQEHCLSFREAGKLAAWLARESRVIEAG